MMRFAFYGRVSTEDNQDPEASRAWQLRRARAIIESKGGEIVVEFFDIDKSRSIPWARRPQASALLAQLKNPNRNFDAVVIGEPHRAFYGNQYGLTYPVFEHFRIPLWVPEVGGPIDPANEAHDMIMSVFGGLSKGERNRVRVRVRTAMAAITATEGRYLGGRPPYGYRLVDAGPHPNPAKAADGKRLHKLELDPIAAPVVRRIFAEFLGRAGSIERGLFAIAEGLTRDGILSPSAHDRARNRHREGIAWAKSAVRAILTTPVNVSDGGNATVEGRRDAMTGAPRLTGDFQSEKAAATHHEKIHSVTVWRSVRFELCGGAPASRHGRIRFCRRSACGRPPRQRGHQRRR
jgi:site-specific DNA recombinase